MSTILQGFARKIYTAIKKSRQRKTKTKYVFLLVCVSSPHSKFVQKPLHLYAFNLHSEVFFSTEERSKILRSFGWSLIGIHACEHRTPAVGVRYICMGRVLFPQVQCLSTHELHWRQGQTLQSQLSSFWYLLRYRCWPQCAGSRGEWTLNSGCP